MQQSQTQWQCICAKRMMFSAASVQIAAALAIQQDYSRIQMPRKSLATNALLSASGAWHILSYRCLDCIMKTYAIHWKSSVTGSIGMGTKLFEKKEAERLAAELNEGYPDIDHEAVIPVPSAAEPAVAEPA
jgi:hypothetical protein